MSQITFNIKFIINKLVLFLFLLQEVITMRKTVVVLLLTFLISLSQEQNFGLTESDYDEDKTTSELSDKPPVESNQWVHSVIFEPLPKVKLTRSSYQVTTF